MLTDDNILGFIKLLETVKQLSHDEAQKFPIHSKFTDRSYMAGWMDGIDKCIELLRKGMDQTDT